MAPVLLNFYFCRPITPPPLPPYYPIFPRKYLAWVRDRSAYLCFPPPTSPGWSPPPSMLGWWWWWWWGGGGGVLPMINLITLLDKNVKSAVYTGGDIHGIYRYLEIIGSPTTLTTSDQRSHRIYPSPPINNYAANLQPVIIALCMRQKIICECCGRIIHKTDVCIIRGTKFLPLNLRRKMDYFNTINGDEPKELQREWNNQPPEAHFKSRSSPYRTNHVISAIIGKLNHRAMDNGDVKIPTSDVPVSLTMTQFQTHTPLQLNQFIMIKWIISWNSYTQNMMKIF